MSEATTVALFHELAVSTREPNLCTFLRGKTGRDAYNALLGLISESMDATPTVVPAGGDVDRAGDLLAQQCQKYYENRKR